MWRKLFRGGKKAFKAAEHAHFGDILVSTVFDWRPWILALVPGAGGVVTFLWAAIEGRSPLDVWIVVVIVITALFAAVYFAFSLLDRFHSPKLAFDTAPALTFEIDRAERKLGSYDIALALKITNGSRPLDNILVKMDHFDGPMPVNMPRPFVLRTENQILDSRNTPFQLRANESKTIPIIYRNPKRPMEWSFLGSNNTRYESTATPFRMIVAAYVGASSSVYEIFSDVDAGWKLFPVISLVAVNGNPVAPSDTSNLALRHMRAQLIEQARRFVSETVRNNSDYRYFRQMLESDPVFFKLKPHLSANFIKIATGAVMALSLGRSRSTIPTIASLFLRELERLENEWGLR